MKIDIFSIGPITIHGYGLMIAIGILACLFLAVYRAKGKGLDPEAVLDIAIYGVIGGFVGAKLLYVIVEFDHFMKDPLSVLGSEGFVVYGGIIAGILVGMLYCKRKKLVFWDYLDLAAPSISIAQGFGRLGCLLAGCCYGRQTDAWYGITFPEGCLAPAGVKLVPTQVISSLGDFLIMTILILYAKRSKHSGDIGAMYMLLYGIGRFFVEFLRNDDRGALGALSTSQMISIIYVVGAALLFWLNRKREVNK